MYPEEKNYQDVSTHDMVLELSDLSYRIGSKQILKNVSVQVKRGSCVGLIGPNGSGKTSLLRHIYRACPLERGKLKLFGREFLDYSIQDTAKLTTVMKQEGGTSFPYTVQEVVMMGRSPYHRAFEGDSAQDLVIVREALEIVCMQDHHARLFPSLSGGEKQRVLMARSLAQDSELFLLDEPTNHLDIYHQWSLMSQLTSMNKTILAVFHELNLAAAYCDYIYVLKEGQIVAQGSPDDVYTKELFATVFSIDVDVQTSDKGVVRIACNGVLDEA